MHFQLAIMTGGKVFRYRPTLGWTVDEASLLCQANICSPTVQPWVGRWRHAAYPPQEAECSLYIRYLLFTRKYGRPCMIITAREKGSRVISLYTTTLIDKSIRLVCAYPMREMRSSSFSSSNLMLRPLIATTLSRASRLRVRMALLVVMLLRLAISSRLNLILSVHPSSSMP